MIEANDVAVLNALSEAIDRLTQARDELRDSGSVAALIDDGHAIAQELRLVHVVGRQQNRAARGVELLEHGPELTP